MSDVAKKVETLMEAMPLGLPVVATDCPCGGPAEVIKSHAPDKPLPETAFTYPDTYDDYGRG